MTGVDDGLVWESPPGRSFPIRDLVAALRTRPGEWALDPAGPFDANVAGRRRESYPGTEWTCRKRDDGRYDIWGRWTGAASTDHAETAIAFAAELTWSAPKRRPGGGTRVQQLVQALRERPGEWARDPEQVSNTSYVTNRTRQYPGTEWTARKRDDGRYDIWGRWTGDTTP